MRERSVPPYVGGRSPRRSRDGRLALELPEGEPAVHDGHPVLGPLRLSGGLRVLEIGGGLALALGLGRSRARVVTLVPDPVLARRVAARASGHDVTVIPTTLRDWIDTNIGDAAFDAVVCLDLPATGHPAPTSLDLLISAADRFLLPMGTLLIGNGGGLRGRGSSRADVPGNGPERLGRAALEAALAERGFVDQRWFMPFPDRQRGWVVLDSRVWELPGAAAIVNLLVRTPMAGRQNGTPPSTDHGAAFRAAVDAGNVSDLSDTLVVAAARAEGRMGMTVRSGLGWLLDPPERRDAWRTQRELHRDATGWTLRPLRSRASHHSGPLALEPSVAVLPVGPCGEDVIADAIATNGPLAIGTVDLLREWWASAKAAIRSHPAGTWQLDVGPGQFVHAEGRWHPIAQDLRWRFPVPVEVFAYRGLRTMVSDRVLPATRLHGISATTTLDEVVRMIMGAMGIPNGVQLTYLWIELETAIASRTTTTPIDQLAFKRSLVEQGNVPIWVTTFDLPVDRQVESVTSGELRAEALAVAGEIGGLKEELARVRSLQRRVDG